ncbi:MAG: threonylcarbamoyl-AMP synthase [Bdellovibrionaceae bacterium]|nr:threonylcarbamoyl-AMP synthase [Pseudobdellovibrionaceae bacterium]
MTPADLKKALDLLAHDGVVGMPTETVYGLAARIDRPEGLRRIFTTKERPFFDPLIVHVANVSQARALAKEWPKAAEILTRAFWPGPLTLILNKADSVNPLITSGLETVGIRQPDHPIALELIRQASVPLAAPSANRFGHTSPTTASHVQEEFRGQVHVIDGGPCQVGIESTVLRVREERGTTVLTLLRKGAITLEHIRKLLTSYNITLRFEEPTDRKQAPGQLKHHYMPDIPLIFVEDFKGDNDGVTAEANRRLHELPDDIEGVKIRKPTRPLAKAAFLNFQKDPIMAARELYSQLRDLSATGADHIIYRHDPVLCQGEAWEGLLDRLHKASSLRL